MTEVTAVEAMAHAEAAHIKVEAHEDLCAERYANIHAALGGVKEQVSLILKVIGWGGALFATVLLTMLGFFASRAMSTNDQELAAVRAQVAVNSKVLQTTQGVQGIQGVQGVQGIRGEQGDPAK